MPWVIQRRVFWLLTVTPGHTAESIAGEGWLILGHRRDGVIQARNELQVNNDQSLVGIKSNGDRPILIHSPNSELHIPLIQSSERFKLLHFELDGDETNYTGDSLFDVENPEKVFVMDNIFRPADGSGLVNVRWEGSNCAATKLETSTNVLAGNTFFVESHADGLEIDCSNSQRMPVATSTNNQYLLEHGSRGIDLNNGGVISIADTFIMDSHVGEETAYGIDFRTNSLQQKYMSQIVGSTFDGNGEPNLVGIRLSYPDSDNNSDAVLISRNTFKNVKTGIVFTGNEVIQAGSICNVWIKDSDNANDNEEPSPCSGSPRQGFVHFTDGTVCSAEGASSSIPAPTPAPINCDAAVSTTVMVTPTSTTVVPTSSTDLIIPTSGMSVANTNITTLVELQPDLYAQYWAPPLVIVSAVLALNLGSRVGMKVPWRGLSVLSQVLSYPVSFGFWIGWDMYFHKGIFMINPKMSEEPFDGEGQDSLKNFNL